MSAPGPGREAPTAVATSPAPRQGGRIARRALLAAAGLGVCGAGVALTPIAIDKAKQYTEEQVQSAYQAGIDSILQDLARLEGIPIDVAIAAAELTHVAVQYVVGPAANLLATLGVGALNAVIGALEFVLSGLKFIPGSSGAQKPLQSLHDMLTTWRLNLAQLPQTLENFLNWDIISAETYLKALKAKIEQGQAAPTPTPGSGY
jgi:hypothetical protein